MAPPIDYVMKVSENCTVIGSINGALESFLLLQVFQPIAEKFGIMYECQLCKRSATFHSLGCRVLASFPGHVGTGLVPRPHGNWPCSQSTWELALFPGNMGTGLVPTWRGCEVMCDAFTLTVAW